jgi:hypothetical protein
MRYLRQSTAVDLPIGPFLDETDGRTAESALTLTQPDIRLKKNGGAWAQKSAAQTLSHEENGYYEVSLSTTDTDTIGLLRLAVAESGALPVWEDFIVLDELVYDALFGTVALATTTNITAGTITTATNVTTVNGLAAGVITAASIAADAITDAKVASDVTIASVTGAVGSVTGAVGSVTGNVGGNVVGSVGSVTGLTASDVGAIKTKTDSLTFTVANQVDANIQSVNDVTVTGTGAAGNEWGPT